MRMSIPAIRYVQGDRVMYISAAPAADVVTITRNPQDWDPLSEQPHGNRPVDKSHAAGIIDYLVGESNPVIGALVLYCMPDDVEFHPDPESDTVEGISAGELRMRPSAMYDIGDGLHRQFSERRIISGEGGDVAARRVATMGQPFILIPEADGRRRAQDYADLQVNVKPPVGSLGLSMNRREPFNRFMIDDVAQHSEIELFDAGRRIEFLSDSPGKYSAKWVSFKTLWYTTGTLLIGVSERGSDRWAAEAGGNVSGERRAAALRDVLEFYRGVERIPPIPDVLRGEMTMAELREETLLTSGNVMYAIAYSVHLAGGDGVGIGASLKRIAERVDFRRPQREPTVADPLQEDEPGGFFAGTVVDANTGGISTGRDAWEAAGRKLHRLITES